MGSSQQQRATTIVKVGLGGKKGSKKGEQEVTPAGEQVGSANKKSGLTRSTISAGRKMCSGWAGTVDIVPVHTIIWWLNSCAS
jgi:hypothetical protein